MGDEGYDPGRGMLSHSVEINITESWDDPNRVVNIIVHTGSKKAAIINAPGTPIDIHVANLAGQYDATPVTINNMGITQGDLDEVRFNNAHIKIELTSSAPNTSEGDVISAINEIFLHKFYVYDFFRLPNFVLIY